MSLVKIKDEVDSPKPYYAVQVGTRREGAFDDPFWLVYPNGPDKAGYPYEDYEVERVPAHRGEYNPEYWGELNPDYYNSFWRMNTHRKEGEAN